MKPLEVESNTNVLRNYAILATSENKRLLTVVDELNKVLRESNQCWLKDDESKTYLQDQLSLGCNRSPRQIVPGRPRKVCWIRVVVLPRDEDRQTSYAPRAK